MTRPFFHALALVLSVAGITLCAEDVLPAAPPEFAKELSEATGEKRIEVLELAGRYKPDARILDEFRKSLAGPTPEEAASALIAARRWNLDGAPLAPDIQKLLEHSNTELAGYAANTLGRVCPTAPGADAAIAKLIRRIQSGKVVPLHLKFALQGLANVKPDAGNSKEVCAALREVARDKRFRSSIPLIHAYSAQGAAALPDIREMLQSESVWDKRLALYVLMAIGPDTQEIIPETLKLLNTQDVNLRQPAVSAAVALSPDDPAVVARMNQVFALAALPVKDLDYLQSSDVEGVLNGLRCGGAKGIPWILKGLKHRDPDFRKHCASRLEFILPSRSDSLGPAVLVDFHTNPKGPSDALLILTAMAGAARPALPALESALKKEPQNAELNRAVTTIRAAKLPDGDE